AADDKLKSDKSANAKPVPNLAGFAHVHEPGLHPSLEPARALPNPIANPCRRFFVGRGIDHARPVAEASEPHAEIGILGDVVRIPSADFAKCRCAKMVRRTAQRQGQLESSQSWKEHVKMRRVFGAEIA